MSRFVQLHILTSYAASNLNRDDLGAPKSMMFGNTTRLRVSSQSLKRAWRTSDVFKAALGEKNMGTRTKELGRKVFAALVNGAPLAAAWKDESATGTLPALKEAKAVEIARAVAGAFGKVKSEVKADKNADLDKKRAALLESMEIEQLAHLSPEELEEVTKLTEVCRASGAVPEKDALDLLRRRVKAADIAMFGRMLAASARFNVEAAVQVAHAVTVHKAAAEDDFFTAVDDLNKDDQGAGHMGVLEFGAGVFYLYVCVDRSLLVENLDDDAALAAKALEALVRAACTVAPSGKQSSFASRACAFYALAEKGDGQPRGLSLAFLKPVEGEDVAREAIKALETTRETMERVYGQTSAPERFNALEGTGSLEALVRFAAE